MISHKISGGYVMKGKITVCLFLIGLVLTFSTGISCAQDDINTHKSCKYCGMDRAMFAHSRLLVTYNDGTITALCSLHCTTVNLALCLDKMPKSIEVADCISRKLIDAEKAFWVIGGNKPGVMTKRAKWAFESKPDAEAFVKENGGELATFEVAIKGSYDDMYPDTKMIREKRIMKKMQHTHM